MTTDHQDQRTTATNDGVIGGLGGIGIILVFGGAIAWFQTATTSQQCVAGQWDPSCQASVIWHGVGAGAFLVGAMMILAAFVIGAIREEIKSGQS